MLFIGDGALKEKINSYRFLITVFKDETKTLDFCMIRKDDRGVRGDEWLRRAEEEAFMTIDYGDGRGEEIHFLWVSRPPRSE